MMMMVVDTVTTTLLGTETVNVTGEEIVFLLFDQNLKFWSNMKCCCARFCTLIYFLKQYKFVSSEIRDLIPFLCMQ